MDYKELYLNLFNKITDLIEMLKEIQIEAEQKIIEIEDKWLVLQKRCDIALLIEEGGTQSVTGGVCKIIYTLPPTNLSVCHLPHRGRLYQILQFVLFHKIS